MDPCADLECSMKVHSKCECCVMKMHDVLRSIRGVYSVTWDAEKSMFTIAGEVEPSVLLKAVSRSGEHAELVRVKLKHPQLRQRYYNYGSYGPTNGGYNSMPYYRGVGYYNNPYTLPRGHYDQRLIEYPSSYGYSCYNHNNATTSGCQCPLPRAKYVPSYPYEEYGNDNFLAVSPCTIM